VADEKQQQKAPDASAEAQEKRAAKVAADRRQAVAAQGGANTVAAGPLSEDYGTVPHHWGEPTAPAIFPPSSPATENQLKNEHFETGRDSTHGMRTDAPVRQLPLDDRSAMVVYRSTGASPTGKFLTTVVLDDVTVVLQQGKPTAVTPAVADALVALESDAFKVERVNPQDV
jgi:hypothetical protein